MGAILGYRQQRVQFFYDTLVRARGNLTTGISNPTNLFSGTTPGTLTRTNMKAAGFLTSDETFLTYSVRHEVYLRPTGQSNGNTTTTALDLDTRTSGIFRDLLHHVTFQYKVSDKVEFEGALFMTPAGGGEWGFISDSVDVLLVNGEPQSRSIYVLPLPVPVAARQAIQMIEQFDNIPAGGVAGTTAVTVLDNLNAYQGVKIIRGYIDGYHTRDVL